MSQVIITYETRVTCDIDLNKAKKYLEDKGWTLKGPYGPYGLWYVHGDSGSCVLIIDDTIGDFNARMSEFVHELAIFEKRLVIEVLRDLLGVNRDIKYSVPLPRRY